MKTVLFNSGTSALIASIRRLKINPQSAIAIPSYYCEEVIINLSKDYKIKFYNLDDNLFPEKYSFRKILNENINVIILVQYFNHLRNLQKYIDQSKEYKKLVIVDAIHLYLKYPNTIYKRTDAIVYSIKKPLLLNEGALAYCNSEILKVAISFNSLNPKRNIISLLKLMRFVISNTRIFNLSKIYSKKVIYKGNNRNSIESADFVSILIYKFFMATNIVYFLNKNILFNLYSKPQENINENILSFGFEKREVRNSFSQNYFHWPLALNNKRSCFWNKNAQKIFNSINLFKPY